jgi:hypothetical protein
MATTRQTKFVVFDEASAEDERMCAVLVSKDAITGALKAHVKAPEGRHEPDPEAVAWLVEAVNLANL